VVGPVDGALVERAVQAGVELACGGEIAPEWLLDDHACALLEPGPHDATDRHVKHARGDGQVENGMTCAAELLPQALIRRWIAVVATHVGQVVGERGEFRVRDRTVASADGFAGQRSELLVAPRGSGDPDDGNGAAMRRLPIEPGGDSCGPGRP